MYHTVFQISIPKIILKMFLYLSQAELKSVHLTKCMFLNFKKYKCSHFVELSNSLIWMFCFLCLPPSLVESWYSGKCNVEALFVVCGLLVMSNIYAN